MFLDFCLAGICVISSWMLYEDARTNLAGRGYILQNQVSHARFLPTASKHSFVYPTLSLLLSLDALENGQLDLMGGWLFSYGGIWDRITGLRASAYLHNKPRIEFSIRQKLVDLLDERGWPGSQLHDAWLMTMPSFLAVEGINPLTVYFCYRRGNASLWLVVLEIHNTFGERNVHVLETGKSETDRSRIGWAVRLAWLSDGILTCSPIFTSSFDYQWTFPRQFHVSPFNDRSGHYICQIVAPPHPPRVPSDVPLTSPRPIVKITLLTAPPHPQTKLVAILRATNSMRLSNKHLLKALAEAPFGLLLAFPRIAYQAFLLHYHKRLDVYQRPEPLSPDPVVEVRLPAVQNATQPTNQLLTGGIGWQQKGLLECWCQNRVYTFLRSRSTETGISITFHPANPFEEQMTISPCNSARKATLSIYYRSPRLFTILFMVPSSEHALLFGSRAEKVFSVSSTEMFNTVFATPMRCQHSKTRDLTRRIRKQLVPDSIDLPIPPQHPLDEPISFMSVIVLCTLWFLAISEEKLFRAVGARFIPGDEPWGGWARIHAPDLQRPGGDLGSVRREKG